jgi:hypothetical protein
MAWKGNSKIYINEIGCMDVKMMVMAPYHAQ